MLKLWLVSAFDCHPRHDLVVSFELRKLAWFEMAEYELQFLQWKAFENMVPFLIHRSFNDMEDKCHVEVKRS